MLIMNRLRTRQNGTQVLGTALESQQFFRIEFLWLIMPIALWALCTVLLAATILQSSFGTCPTWKSSPLALLHCQEPNGQSGSAHDVEKQHKNDYGQLEQTENKWRLSRTR
jgi:hypothetical protein